jgi:type III pantothenate kinase
VIQLDPETITGMDRLLNALAAYRRLRQACVVVDAGTAVTIDFVDGEGTFHGGAIAPGARMQLRSLHRQTAALPEIEFRKPDDETFGRSTAEAMLRGVYHGIRGAVWRLVERYADRYGAYPHVIATGGDAEVLFADDELVDRIVPELTLHGIAACVEHALAARPDEDGETPG